MSGSENEDYVFVDERALCDPPSPELVAELRAWLKPTDYLGDSSDFKKHLNSHVPHTGEWLPQTSQYQQWHDGTAGTLWLKAIAGAGKSVLAARLISQLQTTENKTPVLFFFFRQIVALNHDVHPLARDWLAQLVEFSSYSRSILKAWIEQERTIKDVAYSELWKLLLDSFKLLPKVYCVVDALDELDSEKTNDFLLRLVDLGQTRPDAVKVLMTSRPLPQIQKVLNLPSVLQVRLEDRQTNKDISLFIQHRLHEIHHVSEAAKDTIRRAVEDRVHPSFLYARLVLNDLLDDHKRNSVDIASAEDALLTLPSSMEDMYSQMLHDHSQVAAVPQERQMLILQLATHASRPLRLLEIATVLDFLDMVDDGNKHGDTKNLTRMSCGPLLEILEDESVSIIHHSFTEFLTDGGRKQDTGAFPVIDSTKTHELLALVCVRYLLSGPLSSWEIRKSLRSPGEATAPLLQKSLQLQHPFLAYALANWDHHVKYLKELNEPLMDVIKTFTGSGNHAFASWIDIVIRPTFSVELMSPLHVAAWAGLTSMAKLLVETGSSQLLSTLDGNNYTPLMLAAQRGHAETAGFLLDCGALPEQLDKRGLSALHFAAKSNHHAVVRLLLAAGVSPLTKKAWEDQRMKCGNAASTVGDTPLKYASQSGFVESVREMIPYLDAESCVTALQLAVRFRHAALVKCLFEPAGIDVNSPLAGNLLLRAGSNRDVDTMKFLISKGVDPFYRKERRGLDLWIHREDKDLPDEDSLLLAMCAPLYDQKVFQRSSAELPLEAALSLALEAGCDVNGTGRYGMTPLHYCVQTTVCIVQKLLDHGADVHARDSNGDTPLHLFKPSSKSLPILDLLLRHGARWDAAGNHKGRTPLHVCLECWRGDDDLGIIEPFVEDWNVQDARGDTPLHIFARRTAYLESNARLLEQLISFGADLDRRNNAGKVPLHEVGSSNIDLYGPVFAAAGANLEAQDNQGRTWLLHLIERCSDSWPKVVKLGVDIHAVDYDGNNALHLTLVDDNADKNVEHLLEAGVDPLHINNGRDTLYHTFMRPYFEHGRRDFGSLFQLRATNIPVLARNRDGETLLHCAFSRSPKRSVARNLLDSTRNPLCLFEELDIASMISMRDNEGRLPIHAAAASCEDYVGWLIDRGAEVSVQTYKKQNLLHVAAAAKQSNVIGLVLEAYGDAKSRAAVNEQDDEGRTPLHYACQSGRPESVRLLLDAGADPNLRDTKCRTPLHMCAHFHRKPDGSRSESQKYVQSDDDTLRVKDIVHLLCRHGADITSFNFMMMNPIQYAIHTGNGLMAVALSDEIDNGPVEQKSKCERYTAHLLWRQLVCTHQNASLIVDQVTQDESTDIVDICKEALAAGAFGILNELANRGVQPRRKMDDRTEDFLHALARWGFTEQFEKFGSRRIEEGWINGSLSSPNSDYPGVRPFILTVAQSSLPNMDILSLIVETFQADVNIKDPKHHRLSIYSCALHILAQGTHWWQTGAIKYLLDHGADANITDAFGRNALHAAVKGGYQRMRIVKLLLENGADPNALSEDGTTPLGLVKRDRGMAKLLIDYGGDIMAGKVSLFSRCIQKLDTVMLEAILTTGTDCNQQVHKIRHPYSYESMERMAVLCVSLGPSDCYALQLAGLREGKSDMERAKVAATVQLLLDHGADPFAPLNGDTTILHDLFSQRAMVDTFLAQPNIEIDQRDARGRTLLLAACHEPDKGYNRDLESVLKVIRKLWDMGADITAATNEGNTVVHLLLRTSGLREQDDGVAVMLSQLLQKCPSLAHCKNVAGYSPIHIAAKRRLFRFVRQLKAAGADIRAPDPEGNTILHHLVPNMPDFGEDLLHEYLTLGFDINARNNDGLTPVWKHFVDGARCPSAVLSAQHMETLRTARADLVSRNADGESLLHLVARMKTDWYGYRRAESLAKSPDTALFKYLLELGLDPLLEDNKQRTPMVGSILFS